MDIPASSLFFCCTFIAMRADSTDPHSTSRCPTRDRQALMSGKHCAGLSNCREIGQCWHADQKYIYIESVETKT